MEEQVLFPRRRKRNWEHLERRWILECDLAYDGGGSSWAKGYRTRWGAIIASWFHHYVASWGGTIKLLDNKEGNYSYGSQTASRTPN